MRFRSGFQRRSQNRERAAELFLCAVRELCSSDDREEDIAFLDDAWAKQDVHVVQGSQLATLDSLWGDWLETMGNQHDELFAGMLDAADCF
jgi:hypothetical protein